MYIVCDIGGTNMRVATASGDALGEIQKVPTPKSPSEGIAKFVELARDCAGGGKITAVTGCIAADTVRDDGTISGATNLREWERVNVIRSLSEALGAPVTLENDAAVAGLGESVFGAGKGAPRLVYLTVSTGVGGGYIDAGRIAASGGMHGIAIGGVVLEDLVSGTAVRKKFGIHPKDLSSLAEREKLADTLAEGLQLTLLRWPTGLFVIGGSMIVGQNPIPLDRVRATLASSLQGRNVPKIKMAELGDNGGLWGGLALLKQMN